MTATDRQGALLAWYLGVSGIPDEGLALEPVAGDASFRRYYRLTPPGAKSLILCDAPPDREKSREFVAVARALAGAGVRVPQVLEASFEDGFLALEDLGDRLLLPELSAGSVDSHYAASLEMHLRIARIDAAGLGLPAYDEGRLANEMDLFPEWFCAGLLSRDLTTEDRAVYDALRARLIDRALAQPQVMVHRDFHARNLMILPTGELAAIDFQDAVIGPLTYDPVSLLRDCYKRWPASDVRRWALEHRLRLRRGGVPVPEARDFLVDFDWMGLQRHIKVLGIFARLKLRDGKSTYLGDLPRVAGYVREVLAAYPGEPALRDFAAWFEGELMPRARRQDWYRDEANG